MGFKVYQGQEAAANLLAVTGKSPVFAVAGAFQVTKPEVDKSKPTAKLPVSQTADEVVAFINESTTGRDIIVVWEPPAGAPPPVAAPRNQPVTIATAPGDWLVTPDVDNILDRKLDGDYLAQLPSGWKPGPKSTFKTSMCGLDAYIVTHRSLASGKPQIDHVIIRVRKRIHCHLFEMKRTGNAGETNSLDDFRAPLADVQQIYATFGIDLVFAGDKIEPERITPFFAARNLAQTKAMVPEAQAANRARTHLWINVILKLTGAVDGLGGLSQVHVETKANSDAKIAYTSWQNSWLQSKDQQTMDAWVQQFPANQRKLARELARELVSPDGISATNLKILLAHEIGHAFGLVPTNGKAGGADQSSSWVDSANRGHCATKTCVMFFENDSVAVDFLAQLKKMPFDHVPEFMASKNDEENCNLYLRACDLSDIRRLS